jgi:hypothetical protein
MKRIGLISVVIAAIFWTIFAGYQLLEKGNDQLSPASFFCKQDKSVLLIHRIDEVKNTPVLSQFVNNTLRASVLSTDWDYLDGVEEIFLSQAFSKVLIRLNRKWKQKEIEVVKNYFSQNQLIFQSEGNYLAVFAQNEPCASPLSKTTFQDLDKKASANLWQFAAEDSTKRTDIYALSSGFTQYKTQIGSQQFGPSVEDISLFAPVLPNMINSYEFFERFYAAASDSIFSKSIMFSWLNKGYVKARFQDEDFIVSDYQPQQLPSLVLLEKSELEDSIDMSSDIKSFTGFQLTNDFPKKNKGRIYVVEIENLSVFTESKSLAENILLNYNLGETIALNATKKENYFSGLPQTVNYRIIQDTEKKSITGRKGLVFEVSTEPPIAQNSFNKLTNWTFGSGFESIAGIELIPDHIRGKHSIFVYDNNGNYKLINHFGKLIWAGKVDSQIKGAPQIIDLFENGFYQLLFRTDKAIHLIDLNGESVGNFPYVSDYLITSNITHFTWKNTLRFLFGNEKGEIVMLSNSGQELNVIQLGKDAIKGDAIALNLSGNLRVFGLNSEKESYLGYLEQPAKAVSKGKTEATSFIKEGSELLGFYQKENEVYVTHYNSLARNDFFTEGKLIKVTNNQLIIQRQNTVFLMDTKGNVIHQQKIPFNEVGDVVYLNHEGQMITVVHDFLENNVYAFLPNGNQLTGFPKEARKHLASTIQPEKDLFSIVTTIQRAIINYDIPLEEIKEDSLTVVP